MARSTPIRRCMTSTSGAMQFVVQLAQEMIRVERTSGLIHAGHHGRDRLGLGRRREDHEPRARVDVLLQVLLLAEGPRAFQDQVYAELGPGKRCGILLREHSDGSPIDHDRVDLRSDLFRVPPVHGVVSEQIREVVGRDEVVDGHDLQPIGVQEDLECCPTDTAKAIDSYVRHAYLDVLILLHRAYNHVGDSRDHHRVCHQPLAGRCCFLRGWAYRDG